MSKGEKMKNRSKDAFANYTKLNLPENKKKCSFLRIILTCSKRKKLKLLHQVLSNIYEKLKYNKNV